MLNTLKNLLSNNNNNLNQSIKRMAQDLIAIRKPTVDNRLMSILLEEFHNTTIDPNKPHWFRTNDNGYFIDRLELLKNKANVVIPIQCNNYKLNEQERVEMGLLTQMLIHELELIHKTIK
tara:strand:- start:344 stop:703 length:360 start_codon:yes stop_codon:yes gene_type:complete